MPTLPPKLGHVPGCLAFSDFFSHNICPPHPNHFLKLQWEIHFWTFFVMIETLQKKFRIEIWTFSSQICFRNQFWTSGSGQTKNTPITSIGAIGTISVCPEVRNWFRKQIWNENVPICGAFQSSQKMFKNVLPIVLSKSDLGGRGGGRFLAKKKFWKSQTPRSMPKFWW